jgi:hypothetical protein
MKIFFNLDQLIIAPPPNFWCRYAENLGVFFSLFSPNKYRMLNTAKVVV